MEKQQTLFKWLALAAVIEWLLVRTFSRVAIHIPKSPLMISVYTAVTQVGQVAGMFVALLALVLLLWIAWQSRRGVWLPPSTGSGQALVLVGLAVLSLLFLFVVPPAWLALLYQLLGVTAVLLICAAAMRGRGGKPDEKRIWPELAALLFPATALLAGLLYQLLPNLYALLNWSGPPPLTGILFNLGEIFVVGSVLVWWWASFSFDGRTRSWNLWLLAAIPALLFALSFWRDPAMTGILTIWSTGLTLFLPWPVYVLALWLAGVTVLAAWRSDPPVAYAVLLLISAGYAPQLSSQLFCALIGLWLWARSLPTTSRRPDPDWQPTDQHIENKLITDNR